MLHDVNYMLAHGDEQLLYRSDSLAVSRLSYSDPFYYIMKSGLRLRQQLHLYEGSRPVSEYTHGLQLRDYLLDAPNYSHFGLSRDDFVV